MDAQALGRYLRQTREAKELTLDEAERALRIRQRILESFELGDFNIPNTTEVQIRGFIRNYARYLGLEEDRVIEYYESALLERGRNRTLLGGRRKKKNGRSNGSTARDSQPMIPVAPRTITDTHPKLPPVSAPGSSPLARSERQQARFLGLLNVLVRLLVAVAALSIIVFVVIQLLQPPPLITTPETPVPGILGNIPPSQTFTVAPTLTLAATLTPTQGVAQAFLGQGLLVTVETTQRTWLHASSDGVEQYNALARPGTRLEFSGSDNISLTASNAEALNVIFNGEPQAVFGGRGQSVDVIFRSSGVEISSGPGFDPTPITSPTPMPTPTSPEGALVAQLTPSNTPGPSPTPSDTPTETLTPSITPTPSNTPTPSDTPTPTLTPTITPTSSNTPLPTNTPTITPTPSNTPTPAPTAILPPRETPVNVTPPKQ